MIKTDNTLLNSDSLEFENKVDRKNRYLQIVKCFERYGTEGLTARECAVIMKNNGYIPTAERNFTAPRLTELCDMGVVRIRGKKSCFITGKTVTVYTLADNAYEKLRFEVNKNG